MLDVAAITCECSRCGQVAIYESEMLLKYGVQHIGCGGVYRPLLVRSRHDGEQRPWRERRRN